MQWCLERIFDIPYHVQSDIGDIISALKSLFFFPLHISTILKLLILDTLTYGSTLMIIGLESEQPLEHFLSLIILVLTSLAIPIAHLHYKWETYGRWEFIKLSRIAILNSDMWELGGGLCLILYVGILFLKVCENSPMEVRKKVWLEMRISSERYELWGKSWVGKFLNAHVYITIFVSYLLY
jgi:hypothetical protein